MKVLLVNAFSNTSSGDKRFERFCKNVFRAFRQNTDNQLEFVRKHRSELDKYLFELNSEYTDPKAIAKFDQLDFIFIDGHGNDSPWSPKLRKLLILVKMCFLTGKCCFGSGCLPPMLSYLCCTGGNLLNVINTKGNKSDMNNITTFVSPRELKKNDVFINRNSGDFYTYIEKDLMWIPEGNAGIQLHSSTKLRNYGARKTAARGSGRKPITGLEGSTYISKLGEVNCCVRLDIMNHWCLEKFEKRDFKVYCSSVWDIDADISRTSDTRFEIIVDSSRGPLLIEYQNTLALHFNISDNYFESIYLLDSFVRQKHLEIKVKEHLDKSYSVAISKSSQINTASTSLARDVQAIGKSAQKVSKQAWGSPPPPPTPEPTNDVPETSPRTVRAWTQKGSPPKRCRPFSARVLSQKSSSSRRPQLPHVLQLEKNNTKGHPSRNNLTDNRGDNYRTRRPSSAVGSFSTDSSKNTVRIQRVQSATRRRPYNSFAKFKEVLDEEALLPGDGFFSVANDGPYESNYDHKVREYQENKKKWFGQQFNAIFGRASNAVHPQAGSVNEGPFSEKLTAHNILNRTDNPDRFVNPKRRFRL